MNRSRSCSTYQDVKLFQAAMEAALQVNKLIKGAAKQEDNSGLASDLQRSTRKVCSGIAAGWVVRHNLELSLAHLEEAQGHAADSAVQLDLAHRLGLFKAAQCQPLMQTYEQLIARVSRLVEQRQEQGFMGGCGGGGCGNCHEEEE